MRHTTFQASEPSGSKEEFFLISFDANYGLNLEPHWGGTIGVWDLRLNKIGNEPPGNAANQISTS